MAPQLTQHRQLVLFDSDGHGLSPWSGRDQMTVEDLLQDVLALLTELQFNKVAIVAHSLFCVSYPSSFLPLTSDITVQLAVPHPITIVS